MAPPTNVLEGDEAVGAFREAERTFWDRYGLAPRERYVELPDLETTVRVLDVGDGPPLLYVHGGLAMGSVWAPLVAGLGGYRHVVIDRPGYGLSAHADYRRVDPRAFSAGVLTGVLDAIGVESCPVVGSSLGGTAAHWLASDHPDRVEALVLCGLPFLVPGMAVPPWLRVLSVPRLNRFAARLQRPDTAQATAVLRRVGHGTSLGAGRIPAEFLDLYVACERLPWFEDALTELEALLRFRGVRPRYALDEDALAAVDQPTLLLLGVDDPFGDPALGERTAAALGDARLEVVDAGGHLPWLDRPTLCSDLAVRFLGRHGELQLGIEGE